MYVYIPVYEELFINPVCDFMSSWSNYMRKLSRVTVHLLFNSVWENLACLCGCCFFSVIMYSVNLCALS